MVTNQNRPTIQPTNHHVGKALNLFTYRVKTHGWFLGAFIWLIITVFRSFTIPALTLFREGVGRGSYGIVSIIMLYLILTFMNITARVLPVMNKKQNEFVSSKHERLLMGPVKAIHSVIHYCKLICMAIYKSTDPVYVITGNGFIYGLFTVWVLFMTVWQKISIELLPKKQKPEMSFRGRSRLMCVLRKSDVYDQEGILQKWVEPILAVCIGLLFYYIDQDIAFIMCVSGICLFVSEFQAIITEPIKR